MAAGIMAFTGCSGKKAASDKIKIAILTDVTGDFSSYGIQASIGTKLAVDEINAAGGINGKQIELIQYDTQTDNTVYQEMARKVCLEDKVDMVIAALAAHGQSEISCVQYIERGYEDIVSKLRALGADIRAVEEPEEAESLEAHIG